jgi:hypothetical protein
MKICLFLTLFRQISVFFTLAWGNKMPAHRFWTIPYVTIRKLKYLEFFRGLRMDIDLFFALEARNKYESTSLPCIFQQFHFALFKRSDVYFSSLELTCHYNKLKPQAFCRKRGGLFRRSQWRHTSSRCS